MVATTRTKKGVWLWAGAAVVVAVLLLAAAAIRFLIPAPLPEVTGTTQIAANVYAFSPLSTDGSRLYFRQIFADGPALVQVSVNGGDISTIPTTIHDAVISDISPDHSQLLITNTDAQNAPFWNLPLPAGSPRRIGDIEAGFATWSPDGKQLVLTKDLDLYIANADGGNLRKLISSAHGFPDRPYFSPDGSRIRFTSHESQSNASSIWEIRADGTNLHQLLSGWHKLPHECCGRWTADGRYYVFASGTGDSSDIFALPESSGLLHRSVTEPIRLTFGPLKFEGPMVSPDGKKIFAYGSQAHAEVVRYDSQSKQLVPFLGGLSATFVSFSRDRKWIAYTSLPSRALWRSRVDGSERMQLTSGGNPAVLPRWSPDGKQIAYMSAEPGKPWSIFLIAADGGSPKPLRPDGLPGSDPTWSADGTQLAFGTGIAQGTQTSTIAIMDMNTHQVSDLPGSDAMFSPRWSPDGRYLAALSFEFPSKKLFLYDFHTRKWTPWITDVAGVDYPAWTADSQSVEYQTADDNPRIRRVKAGDSHPQDLFSLKGYRPFLGGFGAWSDNAADDSRFFTRNATSREIYALDVNFP
jgi:Tol biopolymer transport system component